MTDDPKDSPPPALPEGVEAVAWRVRMRGPFIRPDRTAPGPWTLTTDGHFSDRYLEQYEVQPLYAAPPLHTGPRALADAAKRLAEIAAAVEFGPGDGVSFREGGAVQLAADIRAVLASPEPRALGGVREALEPFAAVLADVGEDEDDADLYRPMTREYRRAPAINIGHLRKAHAVLASLGGVEQPEDLGAFASLIPTERAAGPVVEPPLREHLEYARDLLMERRHGSPARSPGHNARLVIESALSLLPPAPDTASPAEQGGVISSAELIARTDYAKGAIDDRGGGRGA